MMIGITLSLAAILVAWAGQSYGAFAGGSQLYYQQRGQALQENFVIEEVFFNKTAPDQIYIFVRNVGLINVNIVAIYVNGTSLTPVSSGHGSTCTFSGTPSTCTQSTSPIASAIFGVGAVYEFAVNWPSCTYPPNYCPWNTGNVFFIVVTSLRGNQVAYTARAP
jgi:hypothetical protein